MSTRKRQDRPWSEYPTGTKAHASTGGYWIKRDDGFWHWPRGGRFPTPGGDACGACVELPSCGEDGARCRFAEKARTIKNG